MLVKIIIAFAINYSVYIYINKLVIEIKKDTPPEEVKRLLNKIKPENKKKVALSDFFGKLPNIGDGLAYQKKVRNER